jgi:hypothetical protein
VSAVGRVPWLVDYAASKGFRYAAEADERWMRAWEPYVTLRVPTRYEHVLESTGDVGSLTLARFVIDGQAQSGSAASTDSASAWIAIAQDTRVDGRAAFSSDAGRVFAESSELVSVPRRATKDPAFDRVFAAFAATDEVLARTVNARLRRLALSWQTPVHVEVRPGGFVLAPVALRADPSSLDWLLRAVHAVGERASTTAPTR